LQGPYEWTLTFTGGTGSADVTLIQNAGTGAGNIRDLAGNVFAIPDAYRLSVVAQSPVWQLFQPQSSELQGKTVRCCSCYY
jgi:hypothetical protein